MGDNFLTLETKTQVGINWIVTRIINIYEPYFSTLELSKRKDFFENVVFEQSKECLLDFLQMDLLHKGMLHNTTNRIYSELWDFVYKLVEKKFFRDEGK